MMPPAINYVKLSLRNFEEKIKKLIPNVTQWCNGLKIRFIYLIHISGSPKSTNPSSFCIYTVSQLQFLIIPYLHPGLA